MDPYPKVNGKGMDYLRQNGIEVSVGYLEEMIKEDLKEFLERVKSGKQE
jgi:pyrimidine deaminase RibD-like protein